MGQMLTLVNMNRNTSVTMDLGDLEIAFCGEPIC